MEGNANFVITTPPQPMKVACLIRSLTLGGAERQMMGLARELSAAGHDVRLIVYHGDDYYRPECEAEGIRTVFLKKGALTSLSYACKLARYIKREGIETLISFLPGPNIKACLAKLYFRGFRLIVSERNFNTSYLPHDFFRFSLYALADKVVCNNHSQEAFIRERCPWLRGKLSTIVNFAPLETFTPAPDKKPGPVRKIVVAARLCPRKNPIALIRAAEILKRKGIPFLVEWYGAEENSYKKKVLKEILRRGVSDYFWIFPPSHEMLKVYQDADIFCLPSLYEGTSNAIAEALCCGLPVVASEVSDNTLYIKEGENGFLAKPGDVESLSGALERALKLSDEQIRSFGKRSREVVEKALAPELFRKSWLAAVLDEKN